MIPWREGIKLPGAAQVQFVQKAILDRGEASYFNRIPAQDIVVGNAGEFLHQHQPKHPADTTRLAGISDARIAATRDSEGSWLMVYSPNATITIDTSSLKGCNVTASWLSPLTGEYTAFDYKHCGCADIRHFELPVEEGHKDWTLILESNKE